MTRYEPAIDVDALTAIDVHVHIEIDAHGHASLPPALVAAASKYFSTDGPRPDLDSIAAYYRERSDGRGRLHGRRRPPASATPRSPAPRSPRAPRATTTC